MSAEAKFPPGLEWLFQDSSEASLRERLASYGRAQLITIILALLAWITLLQGSNKNLQARASLNSTNSSKPPSSDGYDKPIPKSQRKKTGRKPGGQPGHEGVTLEAVKVADHYETCPLPDACDNCGRSLQDAEVLRTLSRQVFDLPPPPPKSLIVTEFQAKVVVCACGCVHQGLFPAYATQPTQYGPKLCGHVMYYSQRQLLPYKRLQEALFDLHGVHISQGTVKHILERSYDFLARHDENVKLALTASAIVGFDSTGLRVMKELWWLHVARTDRLTFYHIGKGNGKEEMDAQGILPNFKGIAVHDGGTAYFMYLCFHALCNAHHTRELTFAEEQFEQVWARQLKELLLQANEEIKRAKEAGKAELEPSRLQYYSSKYSRILNAGRQELPALPAPAPDAPKKRGRPKKHKVQNLFDRLKSYKDYALAFLFNFAVPFTNNGSEQDERMAKVRQKISGCFRSGNKGLGPHIFARHHGYLSCCVKQGVNLIDACIAVFENNQEFIRRLTKPPR
jgi:transposase